MSDRVGSPAVPGTEEAGDEWLQGAICVGGSYLMPQFPLSPVLISGIDSDLWSLESVFICEKCWSSSVLPAWGKVT